MEAPHLLHNLQFRFASTASKLVRESSVKFCVISISKFID